ncbi:MAG TPA: GNAT family N-acetyltransferase, partial [Alphaproteobacteria bacterium]|nr:GNAT family N-acetyltransferase [Alphaproteobacteria bacterium]
WRWPEARREPVVFDLEGEVVGGSLMLIQRLPLGLGALAVAKWGPMQARLDRPDAMAVYAGMIEALIEEYAVKRRMFLSVLPWATLSERHAEYEYLMRRGFQPGSRLLFPNRYVVNLRLSDAEQRQSFEQKWRYHLKKSEAAGLSFERAGPERLGEFDALYEQLLDRKKFADHSAYDTVADLMAIPNETLRPELFFVRHAGRVVGGAVIFKAGARAVYLYGATTPEALALRAGYYLHWQIIRWLRDNTRALWYDLGGTDGFHGLHQFKKGMAGSAGVISPIPRVAYYAAHPAPFLLGRAAFAARDLLHHALRLIDRLRADRAKPDQPPHVERDPRSGR